MRGRLLPFRGAQAGTRAAGSGPGGQVARVGRAGTGVWPALGTRRLRTQSRTGESRPRKSGAPAPPAGGSVQHRPERPAASACAGGARGTLGSATGAGTRGGHQPRPAQGPWLCRLAHRREHGQARGVGTQRHRHPPWPRPLALEPQFFLARNKGAGDYLPPRQCPCNLVLDGVPAFPPVQSRPCRSPTPHA